MLVEVLQGMLRSSLIETSAMDWTEVELSISRSARLETTVSHRRERAESAKRSLVTLHLQTQESYSREDLKQLKQKSWAWIVRRKTKPYGGGCITLF